MTFVNVGLLSTNLNANRNLVTRWLLGNNANRNLAIRSHDEKLLCNGNNANRNKCFTSRRREAVGMHP